MARTLRQIQTEMITTKSNERVLDHMNSKSKTAIWRLMIFIVAYAIWTLEKIFDVHTDDVDFKIAQLKPHTLRWYRNKALSFQYGFGLFEFTDVFNNENKTTEEIEASRIIKYAAVSESADDSRLILKIATEKDNKLLPIQMEQQASFQAYIEEIKDAGVNITVINYLPDLIRLNIRIVRDPLLLDSQGQDIDSANFPVNDAINQFLKELPFNGQFSIQRMEEKILQVNGVKDLSIDLAETAWLDPTSTGGDPKYTNWTPIDINVIPVAGYFAINLLEVNETQSKINYV